jgi:hypothetical protein
MLAAEMDQSAESDESVRERPTLPAPAPRESGLQLKAPPLCGIVVDAVVCDLSRDPRSEDFSPRSRAPRAPSRDGGVIAKLRLVARAAVSGWSPQNDMPPSTSIVRALK